jgi:hypothetical protein
VDEGHARVVDAERVLHAEVKLKFLKSVATAIQLPYDSLTWQPANLALAQVVADGG